MRNLHWSGFEVMFQGCGIVKLYPDITKDTVTIIIANIHSSVFYGLGFSSKQFSTVCSFLFEGLQITILGVLPVSSSDFAVVLFE